MPKLFFLLLQTAVDCTLQVENIKPRRLLDRVGAVKGFLIHNQHPLFTAWQFYPYCKQNFTACSDSITSYWKLFHKTCTNFLRNFTTILLLFYFVVHFSGKKTSRGVFLLPCHTGIGTRWGGGGAWMIFDSRGPVTYSAQAHKPSAFWTHGFQSRWRNA